MPAKGFRWQKPGAIITQFQKKLYVIIKLNFRNFKMFYEPVAIFPKSVDEYSANYIYNPLVYQII